MFVVGVGEVGGVFFFELILFNPGSVFIRIIGGKFEGGFETSALCREGVWDGDDEGEFSADDKCDRETCFCNATGEFALVPDAQNCEVCELLTNLMFEEYTGEFGDVKGVLACNGEHFFETLLWCGFCITFDLITKGRGGELGLFSIFVWDGKIGGDKRMFVLDAGTNWSVCTYWVLADG